MSANGARHFWIAQRTTIAAWAAGALLQIFLFARPTPIGIPYVIDWHRYVFRALLYELLGAYIFAFPFLALWLLLFTRRLESRKWWFVHAVHIVVMAASLFFTQFDHEIMRFVGTRPTWSFFQVYVRVGSSPRVFVDSLLLDRGGPLVPVILWIGAPVAYAVWARRRLHAPLPQWTGKTGRGAAIAAMCVPMLVPLYVRQNLGGKGPTRRVDPYIVSFVQDLFGGIESAAPPGDVDRLAREYQERWFAESGDRAWRFPSAAYPYLREPIAARDAGTAPDAPPWNVIVIQLETFRAWNMGLTRPDLPVSPTPFVDALARSDAGAYWTRHESFGPPTANGFIAWHCSILPHSRGLLLTTFTQTALDCLPQALRRHGYRAEVFTGFDPDWDNDRIWFTRWYDQIHFYPYAHEDDRVLLRETAARLKEVGRSGQPFMATVITTTNHFPFRSREPALNIARVESAAERIQNTMRYTDVAVRDFVDIIRAEQWFDRTLLVFIGDHGYNLGERSVTPGLFHLYRESTWVPLIIYGRHPRLTSGASDEPVSQLDVAPTVADLLNIREATSWLGHSLVRGPRPDASILFARDDLTFAHTRDWSLVVDPDTGQPRIFDPRSDPLQNRDISGQVPAGVTRGLLDRAERQRRLNDYLIRSNHVWRPGPINN